MAQLLAVGLLAQATWSYNLPSNLRHRWKRQGGGMDTSWYHADLQGSSAQYRSLFSTVTKYPSKTT